MVDALDLAVGELFDELRATLDEDLRFNPDPKTSRSAYRGDVGHDLVGLGFEQNGGDHEAALF